MVTLEKEHGNAMRKEPSEDALIAILEQNLLETRHIENHRFWLSNVLWLAVAAVGTYIISQDHGFSSGVAIGALAVFSIFSLNIFLMLIKHNAEIKNHFRSAQWTAEALNAIKPLEDVEKSNLDQSIRDRVMFKGYLALPLPLKIRTHHIYVNYISLIITSLAFSCLTYSFLTWGEHFKEKSLPAIFSSVGMFVFVAVLLYLLSYRPIDKMTEDILSARKPDNIRITYPEKKSKVSDERET